MTDIEQKPDAFEPLTVNHWVLMIDGIDAYGVQKIELPVFDRHSKDHELMTVTFTNLKYDSLNSRLKAWLDSSESKKGKLNFIDSRAKITETWEFDSVLCQMWFGELDYESTKRWATVGRLRISNLKISSPSVT